MKFIFIICIGMCSFTVVKGQTMQGKAGVNATDSQRKADAGKADVIISKSKNIFDSTTFKNSDETNSKTTVQAGKKSPIKVRKNKPWCRKKSSCKN